MGVGRCSLVVLTLGLVACGGGSDSGDATPPIANEPVITTVSDATGAPATEPGGGGDLSGNRAVVTIGDLTYDLHSGGIFWVCANSDTLISGNYAIDPAGTPIQPGNPNLGVQINFVLLSPDSADPQSPMIGVQDVAAGTQWQTGEFSDVPGAGIATISLVDGVATGSAVFFDLADYLAGNPAELVEGTFEIVCDS